MNSEISSYYKTHCLFTVFKMVLASLIALLLIARFNFENGAGMLLPIVIIPIVYHETIEKNLIERGVGSLMGSAIGLILLRLTENWLLFTLAFFTVMVFSMLYGAKRGLRYTMIWLFITLGIVYSMAYSDILGAKSFITTWIVNLWIGIFITLLVEYTVFPRRPFVQLKKILAEVPLEKLNFNEVKRLLNVSKFRVSRAELTKVQAQVAGIEKDLRQKKMLAPEPTKTLPTNMEALYGAMRVAVTFIATIAITSFLGLPGGFQIVVVAAVSCMQPDLGSLKKKIFDRCIGLILGLAASLVFVLILGQIPTLWCLLFTYLFWIAVSAYFGISRPTWFYFSVQAAVIVILVLTSDTSQLSPTTDIMWQRFSAIFEGYVISTTLMTLFGLKASSQSKS